MRKNPRIFLVKVEIDNVIDDGVDDNGAAFFVEEVDDEDCEWSPDLATSPIPSHGEWDRMQHSKMVSKTFFLVVKLLNK